MAITSDVCHVAEAGDPDVAGLGVIIAFLISTTITAITILLLYTLNLISQKQYNEIDRALIRRLPKLPNDDYTEVAMKAALHTLLLSLSDSMLFLGLSLVLAIYIRLSDMDHFSVYSFKISTTTVWISCLTHLSTLVALRERFYPNGGRQWRIIATVILLVLLAPILVLSNLPTFIFDPSLSFRCACNQISTYNRSKTVKFALVAASAVIFVFNGYSSAITALYQPMPKRRSRLGKRWKVKLCRNLEHMDIDRAVEYTPVPWGRVLLQLIQGLRESFFWQLMWLAFYFIFGLTSLISAWKLVSPLDQWSLSFGQLTPLVILVFTLLPACEKFYHKKHGYIEASETGMSIESQAETETETESEIDSVSVLDSDYVSDSDTGIRYDLESNSGPDLSDMSSLWICCKIMGTSSYLFLAVVTLVVFAWEVFLALTIGGAFFVSMNKPSPDIWTGFSSLVCFSVAAPTIGQGLQVIQEYVLEVQQEVQQEFQQEVQQEAQQELGQELEFETSR